MKKTVILVLCIMMLLSSNVFANTISNGSNIILENIIKEYTELYINTEEFENEAQVMNMSVEELILIKAKMAYQVRTDLLSKKGLMSVSGSLYYANVPLIIQTKNYNCGPTSALQVLYTLGDESNVAGSTNAAKINTLEVAMGTTSSSGTIVGNLTGGINLYASGNSYSYYPIKTSTTTKAQLKEKIKTSLQFDTPPILHAKTEHFSYYNGNSYGHYIAVSSINVSTDIVVLRDCNNNSNYGGTFQVSLTEVYNSITADGGRYIICLTQ